MVHTIIKAEEDVIQLHLPENYRGKEIEIIYFAKDEGVAPSNKEKTVTFLPPFLDTTGFKFDRNEANER